MGSIWQIRFALRLMSYNRYDMTRLVSLSLFPLAPITCHPQFRNTWDTWAERRNLFHSEYHFVIWWMSLDVSPSQSINIIKSGKKDCKIFKSLLIQKCLLYTYVAQLSNIYGVCRTGRSWFVSRHPYCTSIRKWGTFFLNSRID